MTPPRRPGTRPLVLLLVAVLAGLGLGRFVTAGGSDDATRTTAVAASSDLATRTAQLEQAVAADPGDWSSLQALGTAYVARAAETGDASFYGRAREALDRAEAAQPGQPETVLARGLLALALHEFDDALTLGQQARAARPDSAAVLGVVVDAEVELGRYDDAARTLQAMLDRDPGLPALARTSYLRELGGDLDGAVEAMRAARGASGAAPSDLAAVGELLGGLLLQRGDVDSAAAAYDDAVALSPALVSARVGAARVRAVRGDLDAALSELRELTQRTPTVDGLLLLADLQRATGDTAGAADTAGVVRAVADLQGQQGQVVDLEMALFEADAGDAARALELAQRAYDARPDNVFTADALAWARYRSGDVAGAAALGQRALRLGSASPALRWHAAELAAATGDDDAAREHLAVVLLGAPWAPGVSTGAVEALAQRLDLTLPPLWRTGAPA